jgi:hypothetical protein
MPMNPETLKAMKARLAKMDRTMSLMKRSDDNVHADAYVQDVTYLRKRVSALITERDALAASRRVHELDNHHNALACGYCGGPLKDELLRLQAEVERQAGEIERLKLVVDAAVTWRREGYERKAEFNYRVAPLLDAIDNYDVGQRRPATEYTGDDD